VFPGFLLCFDRYETAADVLCSQKKGKKRLLLVSSGCKIVLIDTRLTPMDITGQEILTEIDDCPERLPVSGYASEELMVSLGSPKTNGNWLTYPIFL
jgi:hypothetical protein